jgi:hypothetical protein
MQQTIESVVGKSWLSTECTRHSVDPIGAEVETRDSILLTYFVDAGLLRCWRNRRKRFGNFVRNEFRNIAAQIAASFRVLDIKSLRHKPDYMKTPGLERRPDDVAPGSK